MADDDSVARLMRMHHKAADERVRLLNLHHAHLGITAADVEKKQDAESDLESAIRAELAAVREQALEETRRWLDTDEADDVIRALKQPAKQTKGER
jgi:hypothetical protein